MTTPDPVLPEAPRRSVAIEIAGLMLMGVGVLGLLAVAWLIDPLLAGAALSVFLILGGYALSSSTVQEE